MEKPIAYFITWTTYGSWLPGDERGWRARGKPGIQQPDPKRKERAERLMSGDPVVLTLPQRTVVETTIKAHCDIRHWNLHAVNARTNHVHVVVTAEAEPAKVMDQLKAWCSRHLNEQDGGKKRWWTYHGSLEPINDEEHLVNAIQYTLERQ